jgi:SAM-dependent methyltransferase
MKAGWGNNLWGVMAFFYEGFFTWFPPYRNLLKDIIENIDGFSSPSKFILDAGCGVGLLSVELARRGYFVLGVDRSAGMLRRARGKKKMELLDNLFFLEGDLNDGLSFQRHSFDKILFIHSLYLLENPRLALQNLSPILRPGGELLMCNPCRKLKFSELWTGGWSFFPQALKEKGIFSVFFILGILLSVGAINFIIQYRKERIYHCWDEEGIIELLQSCGFKLKWLRRSCLADSHLLLCALKEGFMNGAKKTGAFV